MAQEMNEVVAEDTGVMFGVLRVGISGKRGGMGS